MSDDRPPGPEDTPTERITPIGEDAPIDQNASTRAFTQPFDRPGAVPTAPTEVFRPASAAPMAPLPPDKERRRLSRAAIALIALGVLLLIGLAVFVAALLQRGAPAPVDTPSASPSMSETPSASPSTSGSPSPSPTPTEAAPEEPAAAPAPAFTVFQAENTANCPSASGSVPIFWSWSIEGASTAWFGIGTDDARAEPYEEVPSTATYEFAYQCSEESQLYTVTAENADGLATHQTVEVVRLLP